MNRRAKLYAANPYCCYCGTLTILDHKFKKESNYATIEHKYSRLNPLRRTPNHNSEQRLLIACSRCNLQKSLEDWAKWGDKYKTFTPKHWQKWGESWIRDLNRIEGF